MLLQSTMGNKQAVHRSFILIGRMGDGKSTLGNLIAGTDDQPRPFVQHQTEEAVGETSRVESKETVLQPGDIYGGEEVRIEVFDQPGLNDPNIKIVHHSRNLMECIRRSKPLFSVTFLIVVNLAAVTIEPDLVKSILSLAEHLARSSYSFFNNAVIVFTHIDEALEEGVGINHENLDQKLTEKCGTERWKWFRYILDWVDGRYIFVNATQRNQAQRLQIIKDLFEHSKPMLRVLFHGNTHFRGCEMQRHLGVEEENNRDLLRYRVEFIFNEDLEPHREREINIEEEIKKVGTFLKEIGQGISVMVVLISLTAGFTDETGDRIRGLPASYGLDQNEWKWWDYTVVIFKVRSQEQSEADITRNLGNIGINKILKRAGGRYTWVATEHLEERDQQRKTAFQEACVQRVVTQCLEVKQSSEGRAYIDRLVLMEMEGMIDEMKYKQASPMKKIGMEMAKGIGPVVAGGLGGAVAIGAVGVIGGPITMIVGGVVGGLMGATGGISVRLAYHILKKFKPHVVADFKKKFPNEENRIAKEDFYEFFIGKMMRNDNLDDLQ